MCLFQNEYDSDTSMYLFLSLEIGVKNFTVGNYIILDLIRAIRQFLALIVKHWPKTAFCCKTFS